MIRKRLVVFMLAAVLLLSAIPFNSVYAHTGYDPTEDISFGFTTAGFQYGYFETTASAGSGTTFVTIGWNIIYSTDGSSWNEVYVPLTEVDTTEDLKYVMLLSHAGIDPYKKEKGSDGAKIYCIEDHIDASDLSTYREVQINGGQWEFNAQIQLCINGVRQPGQEANTFEKALGLAAWGDNTKNDLHTDYYERPGSSKPEPIAIPDFDIIYKGDIVNGKTIEKDMNDLKIVLEDQSTPPSAANPITKREWYYWNVSSGWKLISGTGTNDTTVTINNCDADLLGTKPLKKAFMLVIKDKYDSTYSASGPKYEVGFTVSTGTITVHYLNASTGNPVQSNTVMKDLAFGTYTVEPKTISGYTVVNPGSKSVTISATNPTVDVYFYYTSNAGGTDGGIIVTYFKDQNNADIKECTSKPYAYGTYSIAADTIPNYTLTSASPVSVTLDASNRYKEVTFIYKGTSTKPPSNPPSAILETPKEVMAGAVVKANGGKSWSNNEGGYIADYYFEYEGANLEEDKDSYVRIWYPKTGTYEVYLEVEDEKGAHDDMTNEIKVTPPIPTASFIVSGKLKENRKVTVDGSGSTSTKYYPIDPTKTVWTITALTGGTAADIKYTGSLAGFVVKDVLFKKAGTYRITLMVTNTYGLSAFASQTITIAQDLPPVARIELPSPSGIMYKTYRDPNNSNISTAQVYNTSYSPDGDTINKAAAMYCYDSDNDGDYKDEQWYYSLNGASWTPTGMNYTNTVSSFNIFNIAISNVPTFTLKTKAVGRYHFAIRVMEDIPTADTIPAFITENDYRRDDDF